MKVEEWVQATAKKIEGRLAEDAERAANLRKRFDDGVERYRKQVLDLVQSVNALIPTEGNRIQVILLANGISLATGYKRIVTVEEPGAWPEERVPACVGRVAIERENRRAAEPPEPDKLFVTSSGTQVTLYQRAGREQKLEIVGEAKFREFVEYFAT